MVLAVFAAIARGREAFTAGNASDKLAIAADMRTTGLAASLTLALAAANATLAR